MNKVILDTSDHSLFHKSASLRLGKKYNCNFSSAKGWSSENNCFTICPFSFLNCSLNPHKLLANLILIEAIQCNFIGLIYLNFQKS